MYVCECLACVTFDANRIIREQMEEKRGGHYTSENEELLLKNGCMCSGHHVIAADEIEWMRPESSSSRLPAAA